ncbi:MAG TPA: hypothetical protein VEW47_07360 [Candidatus Dormibacteraeota bacterium]|nr:hypothetical protein [Candidatus Dormibacteraeota bacterium]
MRRPLVPVLMVAALLAASPAIAAPHELCAGFLTAPPGTRVGIPITLFDGDGVAGMQVDIHFDPANLAPAAVHLGADTAAAGVWLVDSALRGPGIMTVLLYTNPPRALTPGFKRMAIVDFDVVAAASLSNMPLPLSGCVLGDVNALSLPCTICLQPGVTLAAPRFFISLAQDDLVFHPSAIVVEQGDWVLWDNVGSSLFHTTTSGTRDPSTRTCTADGLWRGELQPDQQFARQFLEPEGSLLPYFCEPDCAAGQTGTVAVTGPIVLMLSGGPGVSLLTWQGGSGRYLVHRGEEPSFTGTTTTSLVPDGGDTGTTLTEPAVPVAGGIFFYLVANKP